MLVESKIYALPYERELAFSEREALLSILGESCRERVQGYHYFADQDRSILGEYLSKHMLSKLCDVSFNEIRFCRTALGKPYWNDDIHFNISHSGKWILCGIAASPIGVDTEHIKPVMLENVETVLTERERQIITESPEKDELFYRIWSAKESYLKAIGKGFNISANEIEYDPLEGVWTRRIDETELITKEYKIDPEYSCCASVLNGKLPSEIVNVRDLLY